MMASFLAKVIAGLSEELFMDLFKAIVREYTLNKKKGDIGKAVADLKTIIDQTATGDMTDAEKNARLTDAGRAVVDKLRDN